MGRCSHQADLEEEVVVAAFSHIMSVCVDEERWSLRCDGSEETGILG